MTRKYSAVTRRKTGFKEQRPVFVIATDGTKTEPRYFDQFKTTKKVSIQYVRDTNLPKIFRRLNTYCHEHGVKPKEDNVWLVIDKDTKSTNHLNEIAADCKKKGYDLAVSNPCFEYWLYLHLAEHKPFASASSCIRALTRKLGTYDKAKYDLARFKPDIDSAVKKAQRNDSGNSHSWPKDTGTHVYKLVKKLPEI
ncbi:hypothetical protein MNBD_DELTA01-503 [hydrothermal vent metagenome]|uniref:RloB-like protein n=1 Tax=hydrothermal vent metagenome TaxID=652676 RepID=A0A3B0QLU8_9ZZZZ